MATPALLPLSGRRLPPLNLGTSFPHHRATLRLSEKFILLLILSAFITLCFGAFFFLPDSSKHKRFDLGLEDVLIPHVDTSKGGKNLGGYLIHGQGHDEHRHSATQTGLVSQSIHRVKLTGFTVLERRINLWSRKRGSRKDCYWTRTET
nr:mannosyl-oligosaccharide 1,2-alpha-mannosidase IB-like isoform X2 [Chelonoidis abingdonii]